MASPMHERPDASGGTRAETGRRSPFTVDEDEPRRKPRLTLPAILSLRERLTQPRRVTEWRISGWQQVGHRVVYAAQFKSGKTITMGNLGRSLLDGSPFLDRWEVSPIKGTLALFDFEMAEDKRGQLDDWYAAQGLKADDRLLIIPMRGRARLFDITNDELLKMWAKLLRERGVTYVIIDCLRPIMDALGLDENRDAGRFLERFDALLVEAGIHEAVVVHHMGHSGERSRGDSRILDWPDVNWSLVRESEDPASPRFVKAYGRGIDVPETRIEYNPSTMRIAAGNGSRKDSKRCHLKASVLAFVAARPDEWLSTKTICKGVPGNDGTKCRVLKELYQEKKIELKLGDSNKKSYRFKPVLLGSSNA